MGVKKLIGETKWDHCYQKIDGMYGRSHVTTTKQFAAVAAVMVLLAPISLCPCSVANSATAAVMPSSTDAAVCVHFHPAAVVPLVYSSIHLT